MACPYTPTWLRFHLQRYLRCSDCTPRSARPDDVLAVLREPPGWASCGSYPEAVQALVRRGELAAHAALKHLVPFARANTEECAQLAPVLGGQQVATLAQTRFCVSIWPDMAPKRTTPRAP